MKAILQLIVNLLRLLGLYQEKKNKEFDIKNTEEFQRKEKVKQEIKRSDENEKLVASIDGVEDEKALEEIRKRIAK